MCICVNVRLCVVCKQCTGVCVHVCVCCVGLWGRSGVACLLKEGGLHKMTLKATVEAILNCLKENCRLENKLHKILPTHQHVHIVKSRAHKNGGLE